MSIVHDCLTLTVPTVHFISTDIQIQDLFMAFLQQNALTFTFVIAVQTNSLESNNALLNINGSLYS